MADRLEKLKRIRDSWEQELEMRQIATNLANRAERRALLRFQEANAEYEKAAAKVKAKRG